jgi:hypothetical protein
LESSSFAMLNIEHIQEMTIQIIELQIDKICLVISLGCINPNKNGNNFKTIK